MEQQLLQPLFWHCFYLRSTKQPKHLSFTKAYSVLALIKIIHKSYLRELSESRASQGKPARCEVSGSQTACKPVTVWRSQTPQTDWRIHLETQSNQRGLSRGTHQTGNHMICVLECLLCVSVWEYMCVCVCRCFFLCYTHILSVVWDEWGHLSGDCLILWPWLFSGSQSVHNMSCQDSSFYWLLRVFKENHIIGRCYVSLYWTF